MNTYGVILFFASVALAQDEDRPPTPTEAPGVAENPVPAGRRAPDAVVEAEKAAPQRLSNKAAVRKSNSEPSG